MSDRRVAAVVFDHFQTLDAVGPIDVLDGLNQYLDATGRPGPRYAVDVVARTEHVRSESRVALVADRTIDRPTPSGGFDTLIVAGGRGVQRAAEDTELVTWVAEQAATARRVCSVCSGAFLLAATGLLDGHTVTTHWSRASDLARQYPAVDVDADPIHRRSGKIWTSAGVTAGIDLTLALVEEDHGPEAAQTVARWLVMFLRRPGGQTQFATPVWSDAAETEPIRQAQDLINTDPAGDHTVGSLAARVGLSPRHFTRLFRAEVGATPARYVEQIRVDAARRQLEQRKAGLASVATASGFGTTETMRRAFIRQVGVSPSDYRQRFGTTALATPTTKEHP